MKKEYGGFLTLEINAGEEYYGDSNYNLYRYNCAKAAINAYLMYKKPRKIYVPFYMCTSTCKSIEDIGIEVEYYPIDKDLLPNIDVDYEGVCIYLVNYFGIMDKKIEDYATTVRNATLVIDNCHSFFHQPIVKENVANIYSCKKFFGVPDGAYLITADDGLTQLEAFYSADIAKYLLDGAERGTNYCYNDKKEVDKYLASNYTGMSVLTQKLLKGIDYPAVIQKRRENFQTYQDAFSVMNVVKCEG
ncbi:MAG: hypothetical protein IKB01_12275, partial [Lachnospiraceae bacterium]|nr:hypothetical protein [Lachnospiraceae bacterium]